MYLLAGKMMISLSLVVIVVISGKTLFGVFVYRAYGIDHHYHSFLIDKTGSHIDIILLLNCFFFTKYYGV